MTSRAGASRSPALEGLRIGERGALRADVIAGLTTSAVVLPKAMAYATIAGLPLEVGLYTAFVPALLYALLCTSRVLSVSTTTTLAILVGAELQELGHAQPGVDPAVAAATLTALVGAVLLAARVLRLGFVANFISDPVLAGFKTGIGLVIVVDQVPKLLGLHIDKAGFFRDLGAIAVALPHTSIPTLAVAVATLAVLGLVERWAPKAPAPLIAVGGAIAASALLSLGRLGVSTVGQVPSGLPHLTWPSLALLETLWAPAVGIALMSFTETIAAGRAFARQGEPRTDPDQELIAVGAGNLAGALFGAMPAGGGTSQTAVNRNAGATSRVAGGVTAVVAVGAMLVLAPVLGALPGAALAAVVIAYSIGLVSPAELAAIRAVRTLEFRWALVACAGVVMLGTLKGILVAVILSMASLIHLANNPPLRVLGRKRGTSVFRPLSPEHPDDETLPGLVVARTEGRVYFGNAQAIGAKLLALVTAHAPAVLVLDCSGIPGFEYTALKMLIEGEERLRASGVELWLAALTSESLELVRRTPLAERLGRERMFFTVEDAVAAYETRRAR